MTATTAHDRLVHALKSPGLVGLREEEAAELLDAYRAAVLEEAANALACLGPADSLASAPQAWDEAVESLRRMAEQSEAQDG